MVVAQAAQSSFSTTACSGSIIQIISTCSRSQRWCRSPPSHCGTCGVVLLHNTGRARPGHHLLQSAEMQRHELTDPMRFELLAGVARSGYHPSRVLPAMFRASPTVTSPRVPHTGTDGGPATARSSAPRGGLPQLLCSCRASPALRATQPLRL